MITKIQNAYKRNGFMGLMAAASNVAFPPRAKCLSLAKEVVGAGRGLEIGGPSPSFQERGALPIYPVIEQLDNCNFSSDTTWEGQIKDGNTFIHDLGKNPGTQYISEASDLRAIGSGAYDFLLSSHVIEHLANPIKGLHEWLRVISDTGHLILLVPHHQATFDRNRPITEMAHLIEDFENGIGEDDLTHLEEILEHHDLQSDPNAGSREDFEIRSRSNLQNRCLHQHVFDNQLVVQLISYMNMQILAFENVKPHHILLVASKLTSNSQVDNSEFLTVHPEMRSDRRNLAGLRRPKAY